MNQKAFEFCGRFVGTGFPCIVVAEISCNHQQNMEIALKMIEVAKAAGADAVKFQAYTPDTLTLNPEKMTQAQQANFRIEGSIWSGRSFYDLYQEAYTPWEWFPALKEKAMAEGLLFFVTPFDESSVDFLENLGVEAYKVASFEINHIPMLKMIAGLGKPVAISTGVAEKSDIELALSTLRAGGCEDIILLKCTSSYPATVDDANLATIPFMRERFATQVGLSDHSISPNIPAYAVALGASMVEKHFTLEKKGPDAQFSLLPEEFSLMVRNIRECEKAMGKADLQVSHKAAEHKMFMRSIWACKNIKAGEKFTCENVKVLRPGNHLHPKFYDSILGGIAVRDIEFSEAIALDVVKK